MDARARRSPRSCSSSSDEQEPDPIMIDPSAPGSATSFVHDLVAACRHHVTVPEPSDASFADIRHTAETLEEVRAANGAAAAAAASSPHRSEGTETAAAASELMRREADVATLGRQLRRLMVHELRRGNSGTATSASETSLCALICAAAIEQEDVDAPCGDFSVVAGGWLREVSTALGADSAFSLAEMHLRLRMARGETAVPLQTTTASTAADTAATATASSAAPIVKPAAAAAFALADFSDDDSDDDADVAQAVVTTTGATEDATGDHSANHDDNNNIQQHLQPAAAPTVEELFARPYHYVVNTHELAQERVWVAADFEADAGDCVIFVPADGVRGSEEIGVVAHLGWPANSAGTQQPVDGLRPATTEDLVTYERVDADAAELRRIAEDSIADAQIGGIDIVAAALRHDRSRVVFFFTDSVDLRPSYDELHAVGNSLGEELQVTVAFVKANSTSNNNINGAGASRNALLTPQERKQLSLARKKATRMAGKQKGDQQRREAEEEAALTVANGWDPALAPFVASPFAENATGILDEHAEFLVQTFSGNGGADAADDATTTTTTAAVATVSSSRIRARLRLWFEGLFTGRSSAELLPGVPWAKAKVWAFECPFEDLDPVNELYRHHHQVDDAAAAEEEEEEDVLVPMDAVHPELPETWHIGTVLLTTLHAYLPDAPAGATTDGYVFRMLATDLAGKALFISEDESPTIEDAFDRFLTKAPEAITSEAATKLFFGTSELAGVHARVVALPDEVDAADDAAAESSSDTAAGDQRGIVDALLWPCQDLKAHLLQGFRAIEVPPSDSPGAQVRTRTLRSLAVLLTQLRHAFPDTINSEVATRAAAANVPAYFAAPTTATQQQHGKDGGDGDGKNKKAKKKEVKRLPIHHSYFAKNKYSEHVCGISTPQAAYLLDKSKWASQLTVEKAPHPRARLRLWFESMYSGRSAEELLPEARYYLTERRWASVCPINDDLDPLRRFLEDPAHIVENQTVTRRYTDLPEDWNVTTILLGVLKITLPSDPAVPRYRLVATDLNGEAVFVTEEEATSVPACYAEFLTEAPEAMTAPAASPVFVASEDFDGIDERLLTPGSSGVDTIDQCAVVARILAPCLALTGAMAAFRGITSPPEDSPGPAVRATAARALATILSELHSKSSHRVGS